jgi:HK97 family phage prohead protease
VPAEPDLEYKSLAIKELTAEGQVEAVISIFGRDRDDDVMTRDAFKTSDGKAIPMVWSHNWDMPIGKGKVSVGQSNVTFLGQFNMATAAGRDAYESVKFAGDLQEYSIGFRVKDADFGYEENDAGERVYTRTIKDLELFEASPVLVGAAYNTGTLAIKTAERKDIHERLKALKAEHKELCDDPECPFTLEDIASAPIVDVTGEDDDPVKEHEELERALAAIKL